MTNVVQRVYIGFVARLARWLRAGAMLACMSRHSGTLSTLRNGSTWWTSAVRLPPWGSNSSIRLFNCVGMRVSTF